MTKEYISIQEASELSKRSIQTIRRAIKVKKIRCRKQKTPQGFHYLISKTSVENVYGFKIAGKAPKRAIKEEKIESVSKPKKITIKADDFQSFVKTMESLLSQHNEERQNFLRLVNTLQEKIFVLENQLNLLKAPEKKWFSFWK